MNSNNITPNNNASKKKNKSRFNVIDFFIALIILLVVAVLIYAISPWSHITKFWTTDEITFNYVVELRGVDANYISLVKEGDAVINSVTKESLGKVSSIQSITPTQTIDYERDGEEYKGVLVDNSNLYDITVHISATAEYEEGVGYTVNGCRVAVGEQLYCRFPAYEKAGYCVAIDTKS